MGTGPRAGAGEMFQRGGGMAVVVPRLVMRLDGDWAETEVMLPAGQWQNIFTGEAVSGGACRLADLLKQFPVALLVRSEA